jgi:hypothetical protein
LLGSTLGPGQPELSMYFNRLSPTPLPVRGGINVSGVASFLRAVRSRVRGGEGTFVIH